jgi:ankyrin repeat protein
MDIKELYHATGSVDIKPFLNKANINKKIFGKRSLLEGVAKWGDVSTASFMLKLGAKINAKNVNGNTPLHSAVKREKWREVFPLTDRKPEDLSMTRFLLKEGANVNAKNNKGNTPLHIAVQLNSGNLIQLLLDYGADVNLKNKKGKTPKDIAIDRLRNGVKRRIDTDTKF